MRMTAKKMKTKNNSKKKRGRWKKMAIARTVDYKKNLLLKKKNINKRKCT